ncbi:hypothetical protein L1987_14522 [Smallanthus sonchifolius]|uniref:Uncharacterized protein n=1 Tax=Smallanthus sonchifolius TaxID=185202 RepID=A0ACB9J3M2_9ASTR|nr:hypothetical protein L1987_14522 [Smallanthus sonchifolius]
MKSITIGAFENQCLLRKMTRTPAFGFLITTSMKLCSPCSRESTERAVGWYSTGPKLMENDLDVHGLFDK